MSEAIVRGVEHVSIAVSDVETAKRTYTTLGFEPQWVEDLPDQGVRSHVLRAGNVVLEFIETMAGAAEPTTVDRFLARRGEGVHHLCLRVDSLDEAARTVEAAGMRLVDPTPSVDEQGRRVFVHPDSTHGVLLGLVEPHPDKPDTPAAGDRWVIGCGDPEYKDKTYVAAVARPGTPLFISGLTAARPDGGVDGDDMASQARVIFAKLGRILAEANAAPADVVKTTDYILSRNGYRAVADVRREFFGGDFPAATGIVVKELLGRDVLIEMDAVAVLAATATRT